MNIGESNRVTCLGIDNSGYLTILPSAEIEDGTFNTANSKLWSKVLNYFSLEIREEWAKMRQDRFTLENIMKYIYDDQIAKIPAKFYNDDAVIKYLNFGSLYTYCCHGNKRHHMTRWIRERLAYVDSMLDYFVSQDDQVTIRMNKTGLVTVDITTYIPLYFSLKWNNSSNGTQKIKMNRGETKTFSFNSTVATDQEVIIYHAQHIKRLDNLSNLNPSSCILSNAIKLNEVEIHSTELYNINVTNNKYLRRVDLSNCPTLGTVTATGSSLDLSNCKYLKYCDVRNTALTEIQLNTSGGSLREIYYPKTIQSIELIKQRLLETIGLPYGENGEDIPTALYNIDIEECPMINRLNMSDDDTISNTFASMIYCNNLTLRNALDLQVLSFDGFHRLQNVVIENMYNLEELGFNNLLPVGQTSTLKYVALSNCPKLEEIELNCTSDDYEITLANNAVLDFGRLYSLKNITSNCVLKGLKTLVVPNGLESMFFTNEYGSGYSSIENIWASSVCSVSLNGAVVNAEHINNGYKGIDFLGMNLKNIDLGALVNIPKAINFSLSPTHVNPNFNLNRDGQTYPYLQPEGTLDLSNYTESLAKFFNGVDLDKLTIICNNDLPQNDLSYCFYNSTFSGVESINALLSRVSNITNLDYCFYKTTISDLSVLEHINMGTNSTMNYTFAECPNVTELRNVVIPASIVEIEGLFFKCPITSITNMNVYVNGSIAGLFKGCNKLETINTLRIPNVTSVASTFEGCSILSTLTGFELPTSCTDVSNLFNGCYSLTSLGMDFGENIVSGNNWFPPNLETLYDTNISTNSVKLTGCATLKAINNLKLRVSNVDSFFDNCSSLRNINGLDIGGTLTSVSGLFKDMNLTSLQNITFGSTITNFTSCFENVPCITDEMIIRMPDHTGIAVDYSRMFAGCLGITKVVDTVYPNGGSNFTSMYEGCTGITRIENLTVNGKLVDAMFKGCSYVTKISNTTFNNATSMNELFMNCTRLEELDGVTFGEHVTSANDWNKNTALKYVNNMTLKNNYVKFKDFTNLVECKNLKLTGNANEIRELFLNCTNLVNCNMTSDNVINSVMRCFEGCKKIERFVVPELADNVDLYRMFAHCYAITYIEFYDKIMDLTRQHGLIDRNYQIFYDCKNLETIKNFKVKYYPTDAEKESYINNDTDGIVIDAVRWIWFQCDKLKNTPNMGIYNDWAKILFFRYLGDISEFIIGDEVTDISYLFRGNWNLTKDIMIPSHVTNCSNAFKDCTSMTHIHSNWNNTYTNGIIPTDCYAGCTGITHIDNSELELNEYTTCLDKIPEDWGGYGFDDSNTSVVVLDIPYDGYEVTITMRTNFGNDSVLFSRPPLIAWGDNSSSVGNYVLEGVGTSTKDFSHTYAQAGKYVVKLKNGTFDYNGARLHSSIRDNIYKIVSLHDKFPVVANYFRDSSKLVEANISNAVLINSSMYHMFNCPNLTKVIANNVKAINISHCFRSCPNLTEIIGLDTWNTDELTDMKYTFTGTPLTSLDDIADWNTENVVDMSYMFQNCTSLTSLDLSSWDVSSVTAMNSMFYNCTSLTSLNLDSWNTENVTDMSHMFRNCSLLQNLDVSHFNTGKVTTFNCTFDGCKLLTDFNFLNNWDIENLQNIGNMLQNTGITGAFTLNWDLSNVTRMENFISGTKITDLNLKLTSNRTNISFSGFASCITLANWDGVDVDIINKKSSNSSAWYHLFTYCAPTNFANSGNVNIKFYGTITRDMGMNIWSLLTYSTGDEWGVLRALSVNSIVNLLELLEDYTGQDTATLKLGSYTIARLSAEQIEIATNKNWTLV